MPLTFGTFSFENGLATRKDPDLFLAPLAHDLSAEGPSGLLEGITRATQAPHSPSPSVESPSVESVQPQVDPPEKPASVVRVEAAPSPLVSAENVELPLRQVAAPASTSKQIEAKGSAGAEAAAEPPSPEPVVSQPAQKATVPTISQRVIETPRATSDEPSEPEPPAPSRRLGLGAPLSHRPPKPATHPPTPDLPSLDLADSPESLSKTAPETEASEIRPPIGAPGEGTSQLLGERPILNVEPPGPDGGETTDAEFPLPRPAEDRIDQRDLPVVELSTPVSTGDTSRETRPSLPLSSSRPIGTLSRPAQRSIEEVPSALRSDVEQETGTSLADARIVRGDATDRASKDLKAAAFTSSGLIQLPTKAGPSDSERAKPLIAHELVHVAQQRGPLGLASLPSEKSPSGRRLEAEATRIGAKFGSPAAQRFADPGEAAIATGVGTRSPDGSVQFHPPEMARTEPSSGSSEGSVQRAPEDLIGGLGLPTLPGVSELLGSGESVEKMVTLLYDRIRDRFRREILLQREKNGLHTNTLG